MPTVQHRGSDFLLSGKAGKKRLHVTPQKRCADWLKYRIDESGHQTLDAVGPSDLAVSMGLDKLEDLTEPAPLSDAERADKAEAALAKAMTAKGARPKPEPPKAPPKPAA